MSLFTHQTWPTKKWPELSRTTSTARRWRPQDRQTPRHHALRTALAQPPQGRAGHHTLSRWPAGGGDGPSTTDPPAIHSDLEATSSASTSAEEEVAEAEAADAVEDTGHTESYQMQHKPRSQVLYLFKHVKIE